MANTATIAAERSSDLYKLGKYLTFLYKLVSAKGPAHNVIKSEFILITCTCGGHEEAERIAKELVERRLAACVQLAGPTTSVYRWQGAVETSTEILLVIKTTADHFDRVQECIMELHSYDTPEIIAMPIVAGSDKYMGWLREQVAH